MYDLWNIVFKPNVKVVKGQLNDSVSAYVLRLWRKIKVDDKKCLFLMNATNWFITVMDRKQLFPKNVWWNSEILFQGTDLKTEHLHLESEFYLSESSFCRYTMQDSRQEFGWDKWRVECNHKANEKQSLLLATFTTK